jgi:hypothetical protein
MEVGSYTNAGGRVARAIKTDELELEVPLDRFDAEWIKIGDRVKVHMDQRGIHWDGRVIRKSQFVDPATQSQGVFVLLRNHKSPTLLAGEYYRAEFPGHPVENVMEVPRNIIFNTNEVFVIVEGRLEKRVANIVKVNEKTLLFNGLKEGELLVMQPLVNVLEGTLVEQLGAESGEGRPQLGAGGSNPPGEGISQRTGAGSGKEDEKRRKKQRDN